MDFNLPSNYFTAYMKAVERTESPRLFHLWAAVSAISSSVGRRAWLPFGMVGKIFPNHYILLVGPPAVRKSSALNVAYRMLNDSTQVRFAPTDTGGQRQGLLRAMAQGQTNSEAAQELLDAAVDDPHMGILNQPISEQLEKVVIEKSERHVLAAYWSELSGAMGQANYSMMDFLVQTYDGEDYRYTTRNGELVLENTLMNILACTTPTSISVAISPSADGHGFLSRIILVHGDRNYQDIVWPELPSDEYVQEVKATLSWVSQNIRGPMQVEPDAKAYAETLYKIQLEISDPRFAHYKSRRFTHLLKLAFVFAASNKSAVIRKQDIETAHTVLRITERGMPDALGQFGLSPLAKIKQGIIEFLRAADVPVTGGTIQAAFHRDGRPQDILDALSDLMVSEAITRVMTQRGEALYAAKRVKKDLINEDLADFLLEKKDTKR